MTSAPTAPIAPPSVGVAMPRKIVPSTRKISASGGISTMMTCCASRDIRLMLERLVGDRDDVDDDHADGGAPDVGIVAVRRPPGSTCAA